VLFIRDLGVISPYNRARRLRGGVEVWLYPFFNLGASWGVGGQCHASAALPPGKRPGTGWVGPRAGLDGCGKSHRYWDLIPRPSSS